MKLTTKQKLDKAIKYLNLTAGTPTEYNGADGKSNDGHYHFSCAWGGYELQQVQGDSGGSRDVLPGGHLPARQAEMMVRAYAAGIYQASPKAKHLAWYKRERKNVWRADSAMGRIEIKMTETWFDLSVSQLQYASLEQAKDAAQSLHEKALKRFMS